MTDTDSNVHALADVADSGLDNEPDYDGHSGPAQDPFEGTDYTKIRFRGTSYNTLDMDPKIGDEHTFLVTGRIKDTGKRELKTGYIEHYGVLDVSAVVPYSGDE